MAREDKKRAAPVVDDDGTEHHIIEVNEHQGAAWIHSTEAAVTGPLPGDLYEVCFFSPKVEIYRQRYTLKKKEGVNEETTHFEPDDSYVSKEIVGRVTLSRDAAAGLCTALVTRLASAGVIQAEIKKEPKDGNDGSQH